MQLLLMLMPLQLNASRSVASPEGSLQAGSAAEWSALIDRAIAVAQAELVAATQA